MEVSDGFDDETDRQVRAVGLLFCFRLLRHPLSLAAIDTFFARLTAWLLYLERPTSTANPRLERNAEQAFSGSAVALATGRQFCKT